MEYADQEVAVENEDSEAATEEVIIIQDVFESQKVNNDQTSANFEPPNLPVNEKKTEPEIKIYLRFIVMTSLTMAEWSIATKK